MSNNEEVQGSVPAIWRQFEWSALLWRAHHQFISLYLPGPGYCRHSIQISAMISSSDSPSSRFISQTNGKQSTNQHIVFISLFIYEIHDRICTLSIGLWRGRFVIALLSCLYMRGSNANILWPTSQVQLSYSRGNVYIVSDWQKVMKFVGPTEFMIVIGSMWRGRPPISRSQELQISSWIPP